MKNIIYCPVCGHNIRFKSSCPVCGYESARDYEIFPTIEPIQEDTISTAAKRQAWEKQRFQEAVNELLLPLRNEMKQQIEELEQKILRMEIEGISSSRNRAASTGKTTARTIPNGDLPEDEISLSGTSASPSKYQHVSIRISDNTCTFGSYPQGADGTVQPILWRVLNVDQKNHRALLLSDKILDCRPYYTSLENTNWEKAGEDSKGLRYWLNHVFYQKAFPTEAEKNTILTTTVEPHFNPNPKYRKDQGRVVKDKIFLLSAQEMIRFFSNNIRDVNRNSIELEGMYAAAQGTEYAKARTLLYQTANGNSWWWLRTIGSSGSAATNARSDGGVNLHGGFVHTNNVGVRPALWVDLNP